MTHNCKALVITCMDYRFRSAIRDFLISQGYKDDYDMVALAGVTKDLVEGDEAGSNIILKEIGISHDLHATRKLILIHHMDCGGYGGHDAFANLEAEKEKQVSDMKSAERIIKEKYHDLEVEKVLARIDESGEAPLIDFEMVQ